MSKTNKKEPVIDYDGRWKTLIENLFEEFVEFFLPEIYDDIDFNVPPIFLKQDASKIFADKRKKGDLVVDNLVQVRLKDGTDRILLIHIEIQGYRHEDYGKKMYKAFCRVDDKFEEADVTSFVLYIDSRIPKNHDYYEYKFGKTKITFEFPVYLIRDQKEEALLKSDNPFAIAVLVCLKILKIRKENKDNKKQEYIDRIDVKKEILSLLRQRYDEVNYSEKIIVCLVEFVMTILVIPDEMEEEFEKELYKPYILKHQDMELSVQGRRYANMLAKAHFGTSFEEMILKWKQAISEKEEERKLREEALRQREEERKLRKEALRQKEEERKQKEEEHRLREVAEQKLKLQQEKELKLKAELEEQQKRFIINLRFEANFEVLKIADLLKIDTSKVEQVLEAHQKDQNKSEK